MQTKNPENPADPACPVKQFYCCFTGVSEKVMEL